MQSCIEVSGGMLTIGGISTYTREDILEVWLLKDETIKWSVIGKLNYMSKQSKAIQVNGEIFVWNGDRIYLGYSEGLVFWLKLDC